MRRADHSDRSGGTQWCALVPEYHWNKPIELTDAITVGFFKDRNEYWIEITYDGNNSSYLAMILEYTEDDWGFDTKQFIEWYKELLEKAMIISTSKTWVEKGISYVAPGKVYSGPDWVIYLDARDNKSGILGMKVNEQSQLEAVAGIDILE